MSNRSRRRSRPRSSSKTLPTRASTATPFRAAFARRRAIASSEMSIAIVSSHRRPSAQREAAVVAETVEQPAARISGGRGPILALIEKQPGLLAAAQIDVVLDAAFGDGDRVRHLAREHLDALLEPLEEPRARVVARENAARVQKIVQRRDDRWQQTIHPLRQRLHDEVVAVAIDDERRQQIGLAVDEAVCRRVDGERLAERDRRLDAPAYQPVVRRLLAVRQHPKRDLRRGRCTARVRADGRAGRARAR